MAEKAPILSYFLESEKKLPTVAKTPRDCQVGPNDEELKSKDGNSSFWSCPVTNHTLQQEETADGFSSANGNKKRKLNGGPYASSSSFSHAVGTFLASGCCMIPDNVLPTHFVTQCKNKARHDLEFLQTQLNQRRQEAIRTQQMHLLAAVQRGDFRELVDRDGGRRDVRFQLDRFPFTAPGLVYNPIVFPLVKELLGGDDVNLLYAGIMWASPIQEQQQLKEECGDDCHQKWHGDGGHLYSHTHLPPHCINVFYPLVDLTPDNGPTEFMTGTHRLGKFNDESKEPISLCCKAGGAVLFDYRIKHRGKANLSSKLESRPVLYLAYAKPFFRDAGNIRAGNSLVTTASNVQSPPWVSRILNGKPVSMDKGFDCDSSDNDEIENVANGCATSNGAHPYTAINDAASGAIRQNLTGASASASDKTRTEDKPQSVDSGERWVLFRMNVELDGCNEAKVITVHHGDLASELSEQFCSTNQLPNGFVPILADTIQQQMDSYRI